MKTIKSRREFEQVFSTGKRAHHRLLRITALRDDEGGLGKVAFIAPKRLGNAVYRNRCKRLLREAARQVGLPKEDADVLIFATRATHEAHPDELADALEGLLKRLDI